MQIASDGTMYNERVSKCGTYEYIIAFNPNTKYWDVDCWQGDENKWHVMTKDATKALFEFRRFE